MRNEMTTLVTLSDGYDHVREAYYDKGRQLVFTEWTSVKELDSRYININERKELSDEGEWISVSERLPDKNGECLVSLDFGDVNIDAFVDGIFVCYLGNVIAWQPLPEPYKKGGAEG